MNSCSVKLTFSDDDFYYNFIDPRRINGELPTLVLRLLTAYATNDELACQIDQYVDRGDPEVYEARELLLSALTGLNTLSAMTKQALEANDAIANGDTDTDGEDVPSGMDDDAVDIDAMMSGADMGNDANDADVINAAMLNAALTNPVDIPMPHIPDRSADAVTADMLNTAFNSPVDIPMPHIPDRSADKAAAEPIAPAATTAATATTTAKPEPVVVQQDNTEVMNAIGLLTQQVSALTGSVSSLIDVMKTDAYNPQEGGEFVGGKLTLPEEENANTGNSGGSTTTLELQAKTASEKQERTKLADEVAKGTVRVVYVDSTTKTLMKPEDVEALGNAGMNTDMVKAIVPAVEPEPVPVASAPAVEEVTKAEPVVVEPVAAEPVATKAEPVVAELVAAKAAPVAPVAAEPVVVKAEPAPVVETVEPVKPAVKVEPEPVVAKVETKSAEPVAEEPEQTDDDEYEVSVPDFLASMMASLDTPDEEA